MSAEDPYQPNSQMHFIIVDDDRINNFISRLTILRHDKTADIQLFTDPELALAGFAETIRDTGDHLETIILLDINMPVMNGWMFLDEFSNFPEDIHKKFIIYMLSSSIDRADMERSEKHLLITDFLCKPLSKSHLTAMWNKASTVFSSK